MADGGLIDPQGNPISSGQDPGPQIRPAPVGPSVKSYGSPAPARQLSQDSSQLDSSLKNMSDLAANMDKLSGVLGKILDTMSSNIKKSNTELRDIVRSIRHVVEDSDSIEDSFKQMVRTQKELGKYGLFDNKKASEIKKTLEVMKDKWEEIIESSGNTKNLDKYKLALKGVTTALDQVGKAGDDAFDPDMADNLADGISRATKEAEKLSAKLGKIRENTRHLSSMQHLATFARTLGAGTDTFNRHDRLMGNIKQTKQQNEDRKNLVAKTLREKQIFRPSDLANSDVSTLSHRGGVGGIIDRKIAQYASRNTNGLAAKMVMAGGGSAISGASGGGLGLLGRGAGALEAAEGPLLIAGIVKELYDQNAIQNKKAAELAGGGLFAGSGGTGVGKTMNMLRSNLTSTSFYQQAVLGQTFDKNIDVMKNIVGTGRGIGDFGKSGMDLSKLGQGGAGSGFYGSVFRNAIYGGRPVGLSQDESVKLTIKALDEYQATTERVQEFFVNIERSTKAAGISTGKYLEIVEAVGSNFDNMNRSLNSTVTLLNAVGRTGRLTGERMKDVAKGLTQENVKAAPQQMVMLMGLMNKGGGGSFIKSLQDEVETMRKDTEKTLTDNLNKAGIETPKGGLNEKNIGDFEQLLVNNKGKFDQNTYQTMFGNVTNYKNKIRGTSGVIDALNKGDIAGAQGLLEQMGKSSGINKYSNYQALREAAAGTHVDIGDLLSGNAVKNKNATTGSRGLAFTRFMELMGPKAQEYLDTTRTAASNQADVLYNMAKEGGMSNALKGTLYTGLAGRGYVNTPKKGEDVAALFDKIIASGGKMTKMVNGKVVDTGPILNALPELKETMDQLLQEGSETNKYIEDQNKMISKQKQDDEAEKMAENTATTAELFANAFNYLFMKVINAIGEITEILRSSKLFGGTKAISKEVAGNSVNEMFKGISTKNINGQANKTEFSDLMDKAKSGTLPMEDFRKLRELVLSSGDKSAVSALGYSIGKYQAMGEPSGATSIKDMMSVLDEDKGNTDLSSRELAGYLSAKGFDMSKGTIDVKRGETYSADYFELMDKAMKAGLIKPATDNSPDKPTYRYVISNYNTDATVKQIWSPDAARTSSENAPVVK